MTPIPLNNAALPRLAPPVRVLAHRPAAPGIVHLGLGWFHRAHMARYTQDLMQMRPDMRGWGIIGAGLMPDDRRMRDSLVPQDCLYTLAERAGEGSGLPRVCTAWAPRFARAEGLPVGEKKRRVGAAVPIGRMAGPEEIAGLAVFLAGKDSGYIVAQAYSSDDWNWMS